MGIKRPQAPTSVPKKRRMGPTKKTAPSKISNTTKAMTKVAVGRGLPQKMVITHKYREVVALNTAGGALGAYSFSCNGLYDPNITGTGHQPYYFDQLKALYNHYTVIGSKMTCRITNASATSNKIGAYVNDDSAVTFAFVEGAAEQSKGRMWTLPASVAVDPLEIVLKWSAKGNFGKNVVGNPNLQGAPSSNPTEQSYFTIVSQPSDLSTSTSCWLDVEIEYITVWTELIDVNQS